MLRKPPPPPEEPKNADTAMDVEIVGTSAAGTSSKTTVGSDIIVINGEEDKSKTLTDVEMLSAEEIAERAQKEKEEKELKAAKQKKLKDILLYDKLLKKPEEPKAAEPKKVEEKKPSSSKPPFDFGLKPIRHQPERSIYAERKPYERHYQGYGYQGRRDYSTQSGSGGATPRSPATFWKRPYYQEGTPSTVFGDTEYDFFENNASRKREGY